MAGRWATAQLTGGDVRIDGALDLRPSERGWCPRRLPAWTRDRVPYFCEFAAAQPSGVRLCFATDATEIELTVVVTRIRYPGALAIAPPGCFELVVAGEPVQRAEVPPGDLLVLSDVDRPPERVPGPGPGCVRFGKLPAGRKEVEIWLPPGALVDLVSLRLKGTVWSPHRSDRPRWVHYGSSISHGADADGPLWTWPVIAARRLGVDVTNLGLAGNAQLDPFVARTIRDLPADLISLKLGINVVNGDTMRRRTFVPAVDGFLGTIRDGHPRTPILVISPISCPIVETLPGPTETDRSGQFHSVGRVEDLARGALTLELIRELLSEIVARRGADDPMLHYLDGRGLFGPSDVDDLFDGLHPNAAGLVRIGERFASHLSS